MNHRKICLNINARFFVVVNNIFFGLHAHASRRILENYCLIIVITNIFISFIIFHSRRHHIYHSTRSTRELSSTHHPNHSATMGHNSRPISTYYEYETATFQPQGSFRKVSNSPGISVQHNKVLHHQPQHPQKYSQWTNGTSGGSIKNRGPFVTQVTIRDTHQNSSGNNNQPPASKV